MRFLVLAFFWTSAAFAQGGMMPGPGTTHSVGSFVGVVDQDTTANHFWGVVAASSTAASGGKNAVDLSNNSTTCTAVKVLSSGQLDVSTGLYCNGGTQTVTTWCSTNCAVASTDAVARITTIYDQIGSANLTATYSVAPGFILSGVSSKPTGMCVSARSSVLSGSITVISPPWSAGATFERYGGFSSYSALISDNGGSFLLGSTSTANQFQGQVFVGASIFGTATDGTGASDFSHFFRTLYTTPSAAGTAYLYTNGAAGTSGSASGVSGIGAMTICGYSGNYAGAFFTNAWTDPNQVGATAAQAATNLTTVPLP